MKPGQIHLVKATWARVIPIADTAAELFYNRLFAIDPTTRALFGATDMGEQRRKLMADVPRVRTGVHGDPPPAGIEHPASEVQQVRHPGPPRVSQQRYLVEVNAQSDHRVALPSATPCNRSTLVFGSSVRRAAILAPAVPARTTV